MTLSAQDFAARLKAHLPVGWFPDNAPVLDAVLAGIGAHKSFLLDQLDYVGDESRVATLRDVFLTIFADEFFGPGVLPRRAGETDDKYRARIKRELFRDRGTRKAMEQVLEDLTGSKPVIFEPMNARDTKGYGRAMGYGVAGRYGSYLMPFQTLIDAKLSNKGGVPGVQGYAAASIASGVARGGYGVGAIKYASRDMVEAEASEQDILDAINATKPLGHTAWTRIS